MNRLRLMFVSYRRLKKSDLTGVEGKKIKILTSLVIYRIIFPTDLKKGEKNIMATNMITCPKCSAQNSGFDSTCRNCGNMLPIGGGPMQSNQSNYPASQNLEGADKKMVAGICGILLGSFGVHKFILGYTTEGLIQIAITIVTCGIGGIVGFIEGIIYLTKSDEEFVNTYIRNKKGWF